MDEIPPLNTWIQDRIWYLSWIGFYKTRNTASFLLDEVRTWPNLNLNPKYEKLHMKYRGMLECRVIRRTYVQFTLQEIGEKKGDIKLLKYILFSF